MNNDYLMHHGVKGMKWGVRRYQNEDGTLTKAGRHKQYRKDVKAARKEYRQKLKESGLYKEVFKPKAKSIIKSKMDIMEKENILDDWAFKKADELFEKYKDMKIKDAAEKNKEAKTMFQMYFYDILPSASGTLYSAEYAHRSYNYAYDPSSNNIIREKSIRRYHYNRS